MSSEERIESLEKRVAALEKQIQEQPEKIKKIYQWVDGRLVNRTL